MTASKLGSLVALLTMVAAGCGDDAATPTSATTTDTTVSTTTLLFVGTLGPRGAAFYSFTIAADSEVFLTLGSLTAPGDRAALPVPLLLGLGVPRGTGCSASSTITTTADLAAQIREPRTAGVYCASLVDPGTLTGDASFAIRIGYSQ